MTLFKSLLATAALCVALPAFAQDIMITDAYARSAGKMAKSGAAFMVIMNHGASDDRLVGAATDAAKVVELHTHKEGADGVMQMMPVPEGFVVPAHGSHALARGGDHVMMMGLTQPLEDGKAITLTLTFEKAGTVTVDVPVKMGQDGDMPMQGMGEMGGMQGHKHGASN